MLEWLDKDREIAGQKYEAIRHRLIKILHYRGCFKAEEIADKIIDRVARKVESLTDYQGDPAYYFLNVANKVYHEFRREPEAVELPDDFAEQSVAPATEADDFQPEYECLKKCLANLPVEKREFIIGYYQEDKKAKLANYKKLAEKDGIEFSSLHARAFRLRAALEKCVLKCLADEGQ